MIEKKHDYTQQIRQAAEAVGEGFEIIGDNLLVQVLDHADPVTKSGLVMATPDNHKRKSFTERSYMWCEVILTGAGYYDETTKETVEVDNKVGNVVLVNPQSIAAFTNFGSIMDGRIAQVRDTDVAMRFTNLAAAEKFFSVMGSN